MSFDDALNGVTVRVPVDKEDTCETCHGSGARPGTSPKVCPECQGRGMVARNQGPFAMSEPCPRCHGQGTIIEDPCPTCRGTGVEHKTRRYNVKVPAGVKDGSKIRIKGKGEAGLRGGPAGDLYVRVRVETDDLFERHGDDLLVEVPVTVPEAALGATVKVPTPGGGRVSLKVPAGSQDGRKLRLRGKGMPKLKGGHGDLLVKLRVQIPGKLTKDQKQLFEKLAATFPDPRPGWLSPQRPGHETGTRQRQTALHDLRGRGARGYAPADAPPVRAARVGAPAAHGQEHAPLLASATSSGCSASRSSPSSGSTLRASNACSRWRSSWMPCAAR